MWRNRAIKQLEDRAVLVENDVGTDKASTLVLTLALPQTDGSYVLVIGLL